MWYGDRTEETARTITGRGVLEELLYPTSTLLLELQGLIPLIVINDYSANRLVGCGAMERRKLSDYHRSPEESFR